MSDIIDNANDQAEMILQMELKRKREAGPEATGACLACDEVVPEGARWCDGDCRDDYERIVRAQRRNGRRDESA